MYRIYNAGWTDGWIDNDAADGSEILLTSWYGYVISKYLQGFLYIPGGDRRIPFHPQ